MMFSKHLNPIYTITSVKGTLSDLIYTFSSLMATKPLAYSLVVFFYVITQLYIMQITRTFFIPARRAQQRSAEINKGEDTISSCDKECLYIGQSYVNDSGSFQQAGEHTFVYSAYYDRRNPQNTLVRIIGVSSLNATLFCHLWFEDSVQTNTNRPVILEALLHIPIKHFREVEYENVFVHCPVPGRQHKVPKWVALSTTPCGPANAVLPISNLQQRSLRTNYTVCLHKALIRGYNRYAQLVEWVEVNRLFGGQHFVVYNYSGSEVLMPYIEHYVRAGLMDYRSWPLHEVEDRVTVYKGQVALLNDCVYRYMYHTKYLILTDADEFLVPEVHEDWTQLMENSPCRDAPNALFQNTFFIHPHIDPRYLVSTGLSRLHLNTISHTHRFNYSFPCPARSKILLRPELVVSATTHTIGELVDPSGDSTCCMPTHLALLRHYRKWVRRVKEVWEDELNKQGEYSPDQEILIDDRRMYHFGPHLVNNVAQTYKAIKNHKGLSIQGKHFSSDNFTRMNCNLTSLISQWKVL